MKRSKHLNETYLSFPEWALSPPWKHFKENTYRTCVCRAADSRLELEAAAGSRRRFRELPRGPARQGLLGQVRELPPAPGLRGQRSVPLLVCRGQAAWPGGRDRTHAVADSVEHALGNESAFPRSPPCRNTHSATRGLRCRPVTRARAAPPSAPMGTRPVVPCQTTVQFEV